MSGPSLASRFCRLQLPEGWQLRGPRQFADGPNAEDLAGEVEEVWLEDGAPPSPEALEERKAFLSHCFEGFEELSSDPISVHGGQVGQGFIARYENDDFQPIIHQEVVLEDGPVRCTLRLFGPEDNSRRQTTFDTIVRSFHLVLGATLGQAESIPLFQPIESSTSPELPAPQNFPLICHRLMVPGGWKVETHGSTVLMTDGRSQINLRRLLGPSRGATEWIPEQTQTLAADGNRLLGWSRGQLPQGSFSALWAEIGGGAWRSAATRRRLTLRLATEEPLEIQVEGSFRHHAEAEALLTPLLSSLDTLDAESWQTRPVEPWIDVTLDGPWTSTHDGLYVHAELFLPSLELRRQDNDPPFDKLRPSLHEALRQGSGVLPGSDSETAEMGRFQGKEAWRYTADAQLSVRGIWILDGPVRTMCLLQARSPEEADSVFHQVMDGLKLTSDPKSRR